MSVTGENLGLSPEKVRILSEEGGINVTGELFDPRYDYVFKRLFTADGEASKGALTEFLNSVLFAGEKRITDIVVINNEIPADSAGEKKSRFDLRVTFLDGEQAIVEMEFTRKDNFHKRSIYEVSKAFGSQSIVGLTYDDLKKVFLIGIMGFNLLPDEFGYQSGFTYRDEKGRQFSDATEMIFLELKKLDMDKPPEQLTYAEMWGVFLSQASYDNRRDVLEKLANMNGGIKMALETLKEISKNEQERLAYHEQLIAEADRLAELRYAEKKGINTGIEQGIERGIERGIEKNRNDMIARMLKEKMPLDLIAKITDLPETEVLKYKQM